MGGICRGEAGELPPSLDLTFPPTGLSENLGEWKGGGEGKGERKGGETTTTCLTSPTGFCLKYHPAVPGCDAGNKRKLMSLRSSSEESLLSPAKCKQFAVIEVAECNITHY